MAGTIQLRQLTSLRMGGAPVCYFHPRTEAELLAALEQCLRRGLSWRVLGGGSNLLVEEGTLPYAVIHIHAPGFDFIERKDGASLRVGAGVPTAGLLAFCRREGLGGLEFLAGLPGTVGGAVAGNAGAWGKEVCDRLARLRVVSTQSAAMVRHRSEIECAYRHADLSGGIVTEAEFELRPTSPELIAERMAECCRLRAERHPPAGRSAGCIFKNPPHGSAGKLLDLCGLKGRQVGGVEVSQRHANFILNRGGAVAGDALRLIRIMREAVRRQFGIELDLEVRHWPARSKVA